MVLAASREVDPRGCGGDPSFKSCRQPARGRSPRVRGRLALATCAFRRVRSIPAGAGETHRATVARVSRRVDPRGCGGDQAGEWSEAIDNGRSPRVRGRPGAVRKAVSRCRSIPAGAGETTSGIRYPGYKRVDPRGCGGDLMELGKGRPGNGRSPRVRGRQKRQANGRGSRRSIPAGAGETVQLVVVMGAPRVDPRGCGGDCRARHRTRGRRGRSPRVRGRPARVYAELSASRSIPAGAGETVITGCGSPAVTVDPRGCGGDGYGNDFAVAALGRSPRVRGRLLKSNPWTRRPGSIPAGAGETFLHHARECSGEVDPRGCGGDARVPGNGPSG